VLSFTLQPQSHTIEFNEDEVGVEQRATLASIRSQSSGYGFWTLLLLMVLLLFMAQNNKPATEPAQRDQGYFRDGAVLIVLLDGAGWYRRDGRSETTPSVTYLVIVVWTLSIALVCLCIMCPETANGLA
jgi:hypothetical protein